MQSNKKTISNLLFWLLVLVIIGLTLIPRALLNEALLFESKNRLDYLFHFLTFLPLPVLAYFASQDNFKLKKWKILISIAFILSVLVEFVQIFTAGRTFNFYDILANILGLAVGLLVVFAFNKLVLDSNKA
jgi:VanZ family protein